MCKPELIMIMGRGRAEYQNHEWWPHHQALPLFPLLAPPPPLPQLVH